MYISEVPAEFKSIIKKARSLLLSEYKDTRGICLIGSIADGTYNESSDIDLIWIKIHLIKYKRWFKIEDKLNFNTNRKVQLVPFTYRKILWHFDCSSTMAHSIQKGIIIYGKRDRLISGLLSRNLSLPTKEWMDYWFEHWLKRYQWAKDAIKREKRLPKKFCKSGPIHDVSCRAETAGRI